VLAVDRRDVKARHSPSTPFVAGIQRMIGAAVGKTLDDSVEGKVGV
jgi:hypothetical protein